MKFSVFSLLALGAASIVSAVEVDVAKPEDSVEGKYVDPKEQKPFEYDISYTIENKPDADVVEFYNGEEITISYTLLNNEEEDVTVVGVGGSFRDPRNGEILANVTDAKVGPILISAGETKEFSQRIGINLRANSYLLVPGIYVVKGSALALLGAKTKLAIVEDKPISFFAPQLLLLELLLVITLACGGYFAWINFGADYFKTVSKTGKAKSASTSRSATPVSAQATGSKKTVDESWLPDHLKKSNKRKAK